jgi:YidC/Oxa1 family membrane protein insertase
MAYYVIIWAYRCYLTLMNNKKILLLTFFTFCFIVLFDNWQTFNGQSSFFMPNLNANKPTQAAALETNTTTNTPPLAAVNSVATNTTTAPASSSIPTVTAALANSKPIKIITDIYEVDIDTLGAGIKNLKLLKYLDNKDQKKNIELLGAQHNYSAQAGMVNGPNHTHAFTLVQNLSAPIAADGAIHLNKQDKSIKIALSSIFQNIELIKTYTFYPNNYTIDVDFSIHNKSNASIKPEIYAELIRSGETLQDSKFYSTFTGPAIYTAKDKFNKITFDNLASNKAEYPASANDGWVAMVQHYFVSTWLMPQQGLRTFYAQNIAPNLYRIGFKAPLQDIAANAEIKHALKLFIGPQQETMLETVATGLELVKDYGWVAMFAKPLFWLLNKIHGFVGNWGWAIILLTLFLKLMFFPLTAASQKSMGRMKDLQPKITALREKYSKEPQKLQQEMLNIYRKEKINPMGGCLPMLIQIPVFIALYFVLLSSVEMRNAPWISWIKDLSKPDPLYILPVLMAVSMFLQIKLGPKPADQMQAKVMLVMPMLFSVMFFFFPAGLVLYYVVNNVISILQQQYINRRFLNKPKQT